MDYYTTQLGLYSISIIILIIQTSLEQSVVILASLLPCSLVNNMTLQVTLGSPLLVLGDTYKKYHDTFV